MADGSDSEMDPRDVLGDPVSQTTDGDRVTWDVFGNTRVPPTRGRWTLHLATGQLTLDRRATEAPRVRTKVIDHVGDEQVDELELPPHASSVSLPDGVRSFVATLNSNLRSRVLVRRQRQAPEPLPPAAAAAPQAPQTPVQEGPQATPAAAQACIPGWIRMLLLIAVGMMLKMLKEYMTLLF
jgi:hypothetical protein